MLVTPYRIVRGKRNQDPQATLEQASASFQEKWGVNDPGKWGAGLRAIAELRTQQGAEAEEMADRLRRKLSPGMLRSGAKCFAKKTAVGLDFATFALIAALPDEPLEARIGLFAGWAELLLLPGQLLAARVALVPKKLKGWRAIGLLPTLYRICHVLP